MEPIQKTAATSQVSGRAKGSQWWWLLLAPAWMLFAPLWSAWGLGQYHGDQTASWEPCFHLPAPLVLGGGLVLVTISRLARVRWSALLALLLVAWPLGVVLCVDNHWSQPVRPRSTSTGNPLRVMHWNMWHGRGGWDDVLATLERERPDVLILAEYSGRNRDETLEFLSKLGDRLEGWGWKAPHFRMNGSLLVSSRLPIEGVERLPLHTAEGMQLDLRSDNGTPLRLLALDLPSGLRWHRDPLLRRVNQLLVTRRPDLVLGDFNAVRRATQLQSLPEGYRHAYDAAGSGWSYTWPLPIPFLAIDHCLIGPRIQPIEYVLGTGHSDHRWQRLDFHHLSPEGRPTDGVAHLHHD